MILSETTELLKQLIPKRLHRWLLFVLLWTIIAALSAVHWWYFPQGYYPYHWWQLFITKLMVWLMWGVVSLLILYLSNRFLLLTPIRYSNIITLIVSSIIVTGLYLGLYVTLLIIGTNGGFTLANFLDLFDFSLSRHSTFYFLAFWAIVSLENGMVLYKRYHRQKLDQAALQTKIVQLQLDVLSFQLQPHFLFNTLNTISSMVINQETESANDLLVKLSDLLRFNLEHAKHTTITLKEELRFTDIYLSLMQARFQDKLIVKRNIDSSKDSAMVPSMILLPIIENAVKYSAANSGEVGEVQIDISYDRQNIIIAITNNLSQNNSTQSGTGLGLSITQDRLKTLYGNTAELVFHKTENEFKSTFRLPLTIEQTEGEKSYQ